jgi:hypothetical protein
VRLDLATFLVQWAAGGLAFLYVTTRRREVGLGYGWLLRMIYLCIAFGGGGAFLAHRHHSFGNVVGAAGSIVCGGAALFALAVSMSPRVRHGGIAAFAPALDLVAPIAGLVGVLGAAQQAGGGYPLTAARLVCGALFLGAVSDAMLLGHWYLVQPGLRRDVLREIVDLTMWIWPIEVLLLIAPTGMISVLTGAIDDGYNGILGWVWVACAVGTIALVFVTRLALREPYYSAVMSATGLLYLAILTAFGTDLVARAVLSR